MRSTPLAQRPDRIFLPRRLVPRRPPIIDEILAAIANTRLLLFEEGDVITFRCDDGFNHVITILRIHEYGAIDAMAYDGRPHHFRTTAADIIELFIVNRNQLDPESLAMYCRELGLVECEAAA